MRIALLAPDAVGCLAQFGHAAVVAYQEGAACLGVVGVELALRHICPRLHICCSGAIPPECRCHRGKACSIGSCCMDGGVFEHQLGGIEQELLFLLGERYQRRIGADVVLQMLHVGHAAQYGEHHGRCAGKADAHEATLFSGLRVFRRATMCSGTFDKRPPCRGSMITIGMFRLEISAYR